MAFVKVDGWQAAPVAARSAPMPVLPGLLDLVWGTRLRRAVVLGGTAVLHLLALLLVLRHGGDMVALPKATPQLTMIDLGGDAQDDPAPEPGAASKPAAAQTEPAATQPPAEWSIVSIRVPRPAPAITLPPRAPATATAGPPAMPSPAPSGSGAGYDPYAGAAPERRGDVGAFRAIPVARPCMTIPLDREPDYVPSLRRKLRKARVSGPLVGARVYLGADAKISSVDVLGLVMDPKIRALVETGLAGRKLRASAPPGENVDPGCAILSF